MSHQEHRDVSPKAVSFAVLVISDSRTEATDESGAYIKLALTRGGHTVADYALLKNDAGAIEATIRELSRRDDVQVIFTSGGTGASHRDVTVETVTPMLDKKLDGFGELFRSLSYDEIGTAAMMSRAVAGVINSRIVLSIPGSLGAAKLAVEKIVLPEVGHMVREATR